jgi:hypothetical protein
MAGPFRTALSAALGLAVALGTGLGAYSITRGSLGPGPVRIQANQAGAVAQGLAGTPSTPEKMVVELEGVLLSVDSATSPPALTVGTAEGPVTVDVPENAVIERDEARIALAELVPGERVEVKAEEVSGRLVAWKIEAKGLPGSPSPEPTARGGAGTASPSPRPSLAQVREVEGWVVSVSGNQVSITLEHGGSFTFLVDSGTRWEHASGPGDLAAGRKVEAYVVWTGSGWLARKVEVKREVLSPSPSPSYDDHHDDDHHEGDHHGEHDDD